MHVDDLSHVLVAETEHELKDKLLQAGRIAGKEVSRLKLQLSDKSKIIPDNGLTRDIAAKLSDEQIPLAVAKTAGDVGVQMSGATVRAASTLNIRIHDKRAPRAQRVRELVRINPAATKLAMSGVIPPKFMVSRPWVLPKVKQMICGTILRTARSSQAHRAAP